MSASSLNASAGGEVMEWHFKPAASRVETTDLFDAVVIGANELELRPRSELAKYLLHIWLGGDVKRSGRLRGIDPESGGRYGGGFEALCFNFSSRPMLSSGDDPHYTGMTISDEEQKACRALVDEMRRPKPKQRKKASR